MRHWQATREGGGDQQLVARKVTCSVWSQELGDETLRAFRKHFVTVGNLKEETKVGP